MTTSLVTASPPKALGRDFTGLWTATGLANLGDGLYLLVLPLIALQLTTSAGLIAGVTVMLTLAWPVFGFQAGLLVDRVDRRRMVAGVNLVRAVALAALTVALLTGSASVILLYAVALVLGVGETLVDTSLAALVPQTVPHQENLGRANARLEVAQTVTNQFIGPPLGGLLAGFGLAWATGTSALLYVGALAGLALMRGRYRAAVTAPSTPRPPLRQEILAGLRFTWANPLLRNLTLITAAMNVFWAAWVAVLVIYVVAPGPVGLSTPQYGLLLIVMAAGGIAGANAVEPLRRRLGARRLLALDVVGTIVLVGTPALTTNPFLLAAAMFVGGAGSAVWRVIVAMVRQTVTPAELLGRVYSANRVVSWGVLPIGAALGGVVAQAYGVRAVFVVAGLASFGLLAAYAAAIKPGPLALALAPKAT
ncbi:MFS transporter [Rhizocola hellebori]|uniref:MFS transporter n=1 Tax=Rhizocola hellebori TaxID=1392758 RepID=A0A8J3QHA2_9ACTN|nr:MFS transporter [Rhizocola hellebori]GIH10860.1 MFS transporter [Rhizocola hellebori]